MTSIEIPPEFVLGVATSAYQVEGAADRDGRSPSIWDTFSHRPGAIRDDVPGDRGAEQVDRLDEDLQILSELGVDSYRFSISWSRLIPNGVGAVNPDGVEYYNRLIDGLLRAGIRPNVTLYHWDLPQVLQDRGGWANRAVVDWFGAYAAAAFEHFGDRVPLWVTINEPIAIWVGYGMGTFAPGIADPAVAKQAMHHAMLAHGAAVDAFRRSSASGRIGIVIDVWKRHAARDDAATRALVEETEDDSFRFFFDELFAGGLSERQVRRMMSAGVMPVIEPGDVEAISRPIDFLGINVYGRVIVDAADYNPNWWEPSGEKPGENYLSNGVELYPDALTDAVRLVRGEYGVSVPIFISENGTVAEPAPDASGVVADDERIAYLDAFLRTALAAHAAGLGVEGYYVWSLIDNWEWSAAYSARYGVVRVDSDASFDRTWKKSAHWLRDVAHRRALPDRQQRTRS